MIATPSQLRSRGILCMNQRNIDYIGRYNPRRLFKQVDDKLKTKRLAKKAGVSVPELIHVIKHQHEIIGFRKYVENCEGFVIKPAQGSGGKGILVITKVEEGKFYRSNGEEVTERMILRHCSNILSGLFMLSGTQDVAIIETLVRFDPIFDGYSYEGVPDVRLIVFKGFPVMGMLRLSTAFSGGRANLHQGAIGVGLDVGTGRSLRAVQFDQPIETHPDTDRVLTDLEIPQWDRLLELASSCYEMSGLGYIGTDIVLDLDRGPLLLELNARPGLSIQIANDQGLLPRLKRVEALGAEGFPVAKRVAFAKEHFSQSLEKLQCRPKADGTMLLNID